MADPLSLGVEEEYLLADVETFDLRGRSGAVLRQAHEVLGDDVQPELYSSELESATPVCWSLAEVEAAVRERRRVLATAAAGQGCRLLATGCHPFARWKDQSITPKDRYLGLADDYQQVARQTLICGQHVHIGVEDDERRIEVLNRARPWLAVLAAMGANSPYWEGADTGYASYRSEVFRLWPTNQTPRRFAGWADYCRVVDTLVASGAVDDPTKLYWDVRLSARFPTVEFRVSDVCLGVDQAVMMAGLVRALAATALADAERGVPVPDPMPEVLEAAAWKAARHGLGADLIDSERNVSVPAAELVHRLLDHLGPALHESGDDAVVTGEVERLLAAGTGAARQRAVVAGRGGLTDVVAFIADQTEAGL